MEVDIFIPCSIDRFLPQTGRNMITLLSGLDVKTNYIPAQSCCGQYFFNDGYLDKAVTMGEKFLNTFNSKNKIVVPTTSCANFVKKHYKDLFHNTSLHLEYKAMDERIFDFTDFVVNVMNISQIESNFQGKVAFFQSCSANKYGLSHEPLTLLQNVKGVDVVELEDFDECCGFGGQFSLKYEPISTSLADSKVQAALKAKADYITSTDTTCLLHLDSYIKKHNLPIRCIHIIDILAS